MRITLRLLGLEAFDFTIETDSDSAEPGDATSNHVGFALPERPAEWDVPDRSAD